MSEKKYVSYEEMKVILSSNINVIINVKRCKLVENLFYGWKEDSNYITIDIKHKEGRFSKALDINDSNNYDTYILIEE